MNRIIDPVNQATARTPSNLSTSLQQTTLAQTQLLQQRWSLQKLSAKKRWTLLHEDELDKVNGDADALVALVCERYVLSHDEVEKQVRHFFATYTPSASLDAFCGQWPQYIGAAKARWTTLHNQELHQIKGNKENLIDLIRRRYGLTPDEARQQVNQFVTDCAIVQGKAK